jgi:hypothetical protein
VLDKACFDWLMTNDSKDTPHFDVESPDKLDEMATNPDRWTFGPEGLSVQFNQINESLASAKLSFPQAESFKPAS